MNFAELEEKILDFWKKNKIFEKSLKKGDKDFVFYEGPPTANGRPGIHHVEARAFKDLIPRYKTMRSYRVLRKAGWDTHGLPVELEVEKQLGLKNKNEVENYGIEKFNKKCKESVWKYKEEWERMTERIGFWVDMEDPYVTYSNNYIESLWWIIKQIHEHDLLYKGYRVSPVCPRCGTALSSHEVAQGYKNIEEDSVYIKFKIKGKDNEYILAWTTTPWTLPGNVALAVGEDIEYIKAFQNGEYYYLAKSLSNKLDDDYEVADKLKGKDLVGIEYEPLLPGAIPKDTENYKNAFKVYPADFVSTEDGTGVVHTAVMYGIEDYELGEQIGLPKVHTVNPDGTFNENVSKWQGKFVKDVEGEIIKDLKERRLLYKTENYSHDYPFCWRCDTPLLYFAQDSWYFNMSKLRDDLLKNNSKINWIPNHIKEGRFGEWLKEVKDWAISRERYWGTPIPVWQCEKCDEMKVIGSTEEIRTELGSYNKIFLARHGEAEHNVKGVGTCTPDADFPLTKKGEKNSKRNAKTLKDENIDMIFSSPVLRARQTSEIMSKELDIEVFYDERLREIGLGKFDNKPIDEMYKVYPDRESRIKDTEHGVESGEQIRDRLKDFVDEINKKYSNKNILIVSHGDPLQILYGILSGLELKESLSVWYPQTGSLKIAYSRSFDLHRPFVDEIKLNCKCGGEMVRIREVMDCWFDSGSMPFAQFHYPFENKDLVDDKELYPADFISEAIDQTRGWFYTLLAVSTLLKKGPSYKNVICLGHVLDSKGQKMSKSRGNVIDPWKMIEKYGADTVRWYLYTVNQPGEPIRFDEKGLKESRRMFVTLINILNFYKMFSSEKTEEIKEDDLMHVLDKWVISKLNLLIFEVTEGLEKYDITTPARKIEDFIMDLSQWYVRRSRNRFKNKDKDVVKTLQHVLVNLNKLLAPFTPFIAEHIFREMKGRGESVHLQRWPDAKKSVDQDILDEMKEVRKIVSLALDARLKVGIKVRQPLKELKIKSRKLKIGEELLGLIKDEVNIREVVFDESIENETELNTKISEDLKEEGMLRDLIRVIQDLRKKSGLTLDQSVVLVVDTKEEGVLFIEKFEKDIKKTTNLSSIIFEDLSEKAANIKVNNLVFKLVILNPKL